MRPLGVVFCTSTLPVVFKTNVPPCSSISVARASTKPPGATVKLPARKVIERFSMSSSPLAARVTARVPKSITQPHPIVKSFVMLQGPVPAGQFALS